MSFPVSTSLGVTDSVVTVLGVNEFVAVGVDGVEFVGGVKLAPCAGGLAFCFLSLQQPCKYNTETLRAMTINVRIMRLKDCKMTSKFCYNYLVGTYPSL